VSAQGFTLSVVVSFTVQADGTITGAAIQRSSGYAEVDAPVIDAIRRCRFSPAEGAPPARGTIPYVIRVR
jgi:TonB family protein